MSNRDQKHLYRRKRTQMSRFNSIQFGLLHEWKNWGLKLKKRKIGITISFTLAQLP